jgi:uncharacterized protein YqhQ
MPEEKLRLGGMALANGVLVHGPTSWACAVRLPSGELRVEGAYKSLRAAEIEQPLLRGPARLLEAFAVLPALKRRLPEAKFPFELPPVVTMMLASAVAVRLVRGSSKLGPAAREVISGALALVPAMFALRSSELAAYHGAEHISIGTYEHGEERGKEHERCGSHLVGPLLLTTGIGNLLAARAPVHLRGTARMAAGLAALAASTEIFGWMVRHPDAAVSKALAMPGHELQHRVATADPTPEQLEVAEAALRECLRLEHAAADDA